MNDKDAVNKLCSLLLDVECASHHFQTSYTVNVKEKFFEHFAPELTVDDYLEALQAQEQDDDNSKMEAIRNKLIGKELRCRAYIYEGDNKTSITIHPPRNP
mgnify:CR=1 FL=1|jgi:hypothetical protein